MATNTTDISSLNLAIKDLLHSEGNLSKIFDKIDSVVFIVNIEEDGVYRFIYVNNKFFKATGLDKEQVIGKRADEIIPPHSIDLVLSKYNEAVREKKTVRWEETSDYPTGRKTGDVVVAPSFNEVGNIEYLIGTVHDITKRKQMEQEREELIKSLQEALNDIKTLQGVIPICSYCHSIRNDEGAWNKLEKYISEHSNAKFSHGICPKCLSKANSGFGLDEK